MEEATQPLFAQGHVASHSSVCVCMCVCVCVLVSGRTFACVCQYVRVCEREKSATACVCV